jgi:hypothetical protein
MFFAGTDGWATRMRVASPSFVTGAKSRRLPEAPGRFSTTIAWPSRAPRRSASTRALESATPPGENGTMTRTGFVG